MADHSRQISRLREAAFQGWIDEQTNAAPENCEERRSKAPETFSGPEEMSRKDGAQHHDAIATLRRIAANPEPNTPENRGSSVPVERLEHTTICATDAAAVTGAQRISPQFVRPHAAALSAEEQNTCSGRSTGSLETPPESDWGEQERDAIDAATAKLIKDLRVMKRTRFNAQERYEAKHRISVAAFTLAAVFEIGLSLAGTNFIGTLPKTVASFIEFSAQITAVFILGFGLVATLSNYQTTALYLQRCAMDWGNLSRELQIAQPVSRDVLQDYRRRYHEIEARCPPNHAAQDYRRANLDHGDPRAVRADRLDYFLDVYLVYALSALAYISFFGLGLWQALS